MLNSLRFRLPALFLAGIALAGLVTSLIALRLFQDFTRNESLQELRQEARGLADLYALMKKVGVPETPLRSALSTSSATRASPECSRSASEKRSALRPSCSA
jgi:hypothetical protein